MKNNKKITLQQITATGLMAALVFVSTFINIQIPIPGINLMVHLGNVFCILSALILGPILGGLSSGIGSFLFDLINPLYIAVSPFTLIFKFIMGFVCGKIAYSKGYDGNNLKYNIMGAILGLFCYIVLHISRIFIYNIMLNMALQANILLLAQSVIVSIFNAIIAIIIAIPLNITLKKILYKNKFLIK